MCLRFVFLLITRVVLWLRMSGREETWKTAEILILRHQLGVLQRRQPRRPNWRVGRGHYGCCTSVLHVATGPAPIF
jgi:hypothetical protein